MAETGLSLTVVLDVLDGALAAKVGPSTGSRHRSSPSHRASGSRPRP